MNAMTSPDVLLQRINDALDALPLDKTPSRLYDPIRYVLSMGGKRLRPTLCLMACELFTDAIEDALPPALALEVFHNFTLLHDDIMDKALTRRNKPCVHLRWDDNVAILSGDAMQILSYQILATSSGAYLEKGLPLFSQTAIEVCEGQQLDMDFETQADVSVEDYLHMIRLKTAVLLAASLKLGALAGGSPDTDADLLYDLGIAVGLGFQLKDDLLDVYGDPETFGKRVGGDIACNKKTFLLIRALEKAAPDERTELTEWLSGVRKGSDEEKIAAVTRIYDRCGMRECCLKEIDTHQQMALDILSRVQVPQGRKTALLQLVCELTDRIK
jgi:geranylgeranyl diphosphate synthase type II